MATGRTGLLSCSLILLALAAAAWPGAAQAKPGCTLVGTAHADRLVGSSRADVICGRGGSDTIKGRGGNDKLIGGPGRDKLIGGPGRDKLIGGGGRDTLVGGSGNDLLRGGPGADWLRGGSGSDRCRDRSAPVVIGCGAKSGRRRSPAAPPPIPPLLSAPLARAAEPLIDNEPPSLQSVEFSTENVEIATGDWSVGISVVAWDESGVGSVVVAIEGPEGFWREVNLGAVPPQLAELSTELDVPMSTPVGEYRVAAVTAVDSVGNEVTRGSPWLGEHGLDAHFEAYDGPDREAPNLVGVSFRPGEAVDTSEGPVTVEVSFEVTDPGAGVDSVRLRVANPTSKRGEERIYSSLATLESGTARAGTWLATFELPAGATAGFYPIDELTLRDADGHARFHVPSTIEALDFPGGFTQVGPADTVRPEITGFSIEPQVIHTAAGERELSFEIGIADAWSGVNARLDPVSRISFTLTPPNWPVSWGASGSAPVLVSGTFQDGVWRIRRWLEEDAGFGTWTVRWISVTDRAGNTTRLEDGSLEDFEAEGWDLDFENLP